MKIDLDHIPAAPEARLDTNPVREAVANLRAVRKSIGKTSQLGRKIKRIVIALLRQLIRAEDFNLRILLKWEMLSNRHWRRQVMVDLGGEAALKRWDKRKTRAERIILSPRFVPYKDEDESKTLPQEFTARETINIPGVKAVEFKATHIKTDRDGLFRLASIKYKVRPDNVQEEFARLEAKTWRKTMRPFPKAQKSKINGLETFKPIPLTPDELRGTLLHNPHPEADAPQGVTGTRRTGIIAVKVAINDCKDPSRWGYAAPEPEDEDEAINYIMIRNDTNASLQSTPCPDTTPLLETRSLFLIPDKRGSP